MHHILHIAKAWLRTIFRKRNQRCHQRDLSAPMRIEPLEERVLLSLDAPPIYPLATGSAPLSVALGQLDNTSFVDLAVINSDGSLTVALNEGNDRFASTQTISLGLGPANGLLLSPLDADPFFDLVVQGPDGLSVARNDGSANFTVVQTLPASAAGLMAPTGGGRVGLTAGHFNSDFFIDLATVAPGSDELLVYRGLGGTFAPPLRYPSGGDQPVSVVTGQFSGDALLDLAVGHRDGSVTIFQGVADGAFVQQPAQTISNLGVIAELTAANFDGGDTDLAIASSTGVHLLHNMGSVTSQSPLVGGDFVNGLTGWQATSRFVSASNGFVQIREGDGLLTTLQQSFVIPPQADTLSFDIFTLGLEDPAGGVPDAFEVSLLDANNNPVVPTFRADASSFFNVNPGGAVSLAAGVTFDGRTATVNIAGVPEGTAVTLYFDLVGNPAGKNSVVTLGNVQLSPEVARTEGFTPYTLAGPFGSLAGLAAGDVDGDGQLDIVAADRGLNQVLVYNGDGIGNFSRSVFDVSPFGAGPMGIATGPLTAVTGSDDVVLTLVDSNIVLTPLAYDVTPPQVVAFTPPNGTLLNISTSQLTVRFSEPMHDAGPAGANSVSNPAAYALIAAGTDGLFDTSDDMQIPLASVSYNSVTLTTTLNVAQAFAPLPDGRYRLVVEGDDPANGLRDLVGNRLGNGTDATATFAIDSIPPLAQIVSPAPGALLTSAPTEILVQFTEAMIDTGATGLNSVTNPAAYAVFSDGIDGIFQGGAGDDVAVAITSVSYDPLNRTATVHFAAAPDERYQVVLRGTGASALYDLAGNALAGGQDVTSVFTVDTNAPQATIASPAPGALLSQSDGSVLVQFSEAMRDAGPTGANSVTNTSGYSLIRAGADGLFDTSDDVTIPLTVFSYSPITRQAILQAAVPLTDGLYRITVRGADATSGLVDLAGNRLGGGADLSSTFTLDGTAPEVTTLSPAAGAVLTTPPTQITIGFSEAMLDIGSHAVSNPTGYTLIAAGPNGILNDSDDVQMTITSVAYNASSHTAILNVAALADGLYQVVVKGADTTRGLLDLTGNKLHSGMDVTSTFRVDTTAPQVTFINPIPGAVVNTEMRQLTVRFSEAMLNAGSTGANSVTNPSAYLLFTDGANNIFEGGTGDDVLITITSVLYDPATKEAVLVVAAGQAPLADEHYRLVVKGQDATAGLLDQAGNRLGGGVDSTADFFVDRTVPTVNISLSPNILWPPNHKMATINVTITATDSIDPNPRAILLSVTSSEPDNGLGDGDTANDIQGATIGTDDRQFSVRRERAGGGPGRVYTATYLVYDSSGNSRVVSAVAVVPPNMGNGQEMIDAIGDPTPRGLRHLHTVHPGVFVDPPFDIGEVVTGSLAPGEVTVWEFQGTAGQRLYFDAQQYDDAFAWTLADPNQNELFNLSFGDHSLGVFVLPETGAYTLTIDGHNTGGEYQPSGNYQFQVHAVPDPVTTPTAIGLSSTGSIDVPGQEHHYTFSVTAGTRVLFDAQSDSYSLRWELRDALGQTTFSTNFYDNGPITLATAGTYTLTIAGNGNGTGGYQFELVNAPTTQTAISIGDTVSRTISQPYQQDLFIFSGTAGQRVFFDSLTTFGWQFRWSLLAPDGSTLFNNSLEDQPTRTLADSGTYTLRVEGSYPGATGLYSFKLWSVPAPVTAALTPGTPVTGTLASPGVENHYEFAGTADQRLFLLVSNDGGFSARKSFSLLAPDGSVLLFPSPSSRDVFTLPDAGTYTVVVNGSSPLSATGSFAFTLYAVPDPVTMPITLGTIVSGALNVPGQQDYYSFTASAGQRLFLDVQDAGFYGNYKGFTITNPDGSELLPATTADDHLPPLTQSGTYLLKVDDYNNFTVTGSYQFRLFEAPQPPPVAINIGSVVNGTIDTLGEIDRFTFDGFDGQQLFFETLLGEYYQFDWRLVGPNGELFATSFEPPDRQELSIAGTYTLEVTGRVETGAYSFRVSEVPDPVITAIQLNEEVAGTLGVPGEFDLYTFDAAEGQHLYFQLLEGWPYNFRWHLTDPTGQVLFNSSAYDYDLAYLDVTGTYTLGIEGYRGFTGDYLFRVTDVVDQSESIQIGEVVHGSLDIPVQTNAYTFDASAGQRLFFDVLLGEGGYGEGGPYGPTWSLSDPFDNEVFFDVFTDYGPLDIYESGTYTLRVHARFTPFTGEYEFQIVDVNDQPPVPISIGDTVSADLGQPGETDRYVFSADAGQRVLFDVILGDRFDIGWILTDPDGNEMPLDYFDQYRVLAQAGEYTLSVSSPNGFTGDYEFALLDAPLPDPTPITLNQTITTDLTAFGEVDRFVLTVPEGQNVFFDAQTGFSSAMNWKVTGPLGGLFNIPFRDFNTTVLPAGVYVVEVSSNFLSQPLEYSFKLWDVPAPVDVPTTLDTAVAGSIDVPGETDRYTFSGVAGQRLYFDIQQNSSTGFFGYDRKAFTILGPDGQPIASNLITEPAVLTLSETGTYTVVVDEWQHSSTQLDAVGAYRFEVWEVFDPQEQSLNLGQFYDAVFDRPLEEFLYTFDAAPGDRVFLDVAGSPFHARAELLAPDGSIVIAPTDRDYYTVTLDQVGTYTVRVKGAHPESTGTFSFRLVEVPPIDVTPIVLGQRVQGLIGTPGQESDYTFTGTTGQRVMVDINWSGNVYIGPGILRPDGTTLLPRRWGDRDVFVLDQDGTYTVRVGDSALRDEIGYYDFTLHEVPADETRASLLNTPVVGAVTPSQRLSFTFTGQIGEQLFFDIQDNPGDVRFALQAPDGTVLFSDRRDDLFLDPLPATGTYTLTARGWAGSNTFTGDNNAKSGAFRFQMQQVPEAQVGQSDSLGTEYWLAFNSNFNELFFGIEAGNDLRLYIASETATSGVVSLPGLGFATAFTVAAGGVTLVRLPEGAELGRGGEHLENKGIHVLTLDEVSIYGFNFHQFTTDAYLGLPTDVLGTDYVVMSYPGLPNFDGSSFGIVATQNDTLVEINPTANAGGRMAGVPYTITLQRGQTYQLMARGLDDLTGTTISASHPISVFGSNFITRIPEPYIAADHLVEHLPAVETWGRQFVTSPFATRLNGDRFRFLAARDGTEVRVNDTLVATLNRGQFHEMVLTAAAFIESNEPILVAQFAHSQAWDNTQADPDMLLLPPFEQFQSQYTVAAPTENFPINYLNLVVATSGVGTMTLDGVAVPAAAFSPIGSSGFSFAQVPVNPGTHQLAGPVPFGVTSYGFSNFDSYAYPGGLSLAPVSAVAGVELTPEISAGVPGIANTFVATLRDDQGRPVVGVRVDFVVSGANTATGHAVTDALGRATFSYTGSNAGTDTLRASVGTFSDTSTVVWSTQPPTVVVDQPADGATFPAGTVLITGRAAAGSALHRVTVVTVNGVVVDGFDYAGRFFARVSLPAGEHTFTVVALDSSGQAAETSLTLHGTAANAPLDFAVMQDVSIRGELSYAATSYNRRQGVLRTDARLVNTGDDALTGPVAAVFTHFTAPQVTLSSAQLDAQGRPYARYDDEIPAGGLAADASSGIVRLGFAATPADRFAFDVILLGLGNRAPAFTSVPRTGAVVGKPYFFTASASDPDGDVLRFTLVAGPVGMSIDAVTGVVNWTPGAAQQGTQSVELLVSDGRGGIGRQTFQILTELTPANRAPAFLSLPTTSAATGSTYRYQPEVFDPDGDTLSYTLDQAPAGMTVNTATGELTFPSATVGSHTVKLRVADGRGGEAVQQFVLAVGGGVGSALAITSAPPTVAVIGQQYAYQPRVESNRPVSFALVVGPAGLSIDHDSGLVRWTPTSAQLGPHTVVISASNDLGGAAVQAWTVTAIEAPVNRAPAIATSPLRLATRGEAYSYDADASDPEGEAVTYSLADAPEGMGIDDQTGVISWTPGASLLGSYLVTVVATDPHGAEGRQSYLVEVRPQNNAPEIVSTPVLSVTAGTAYRYLVLATDDADAVTYSVVSGPAGMTVAPFTGNLFWRTAMADIGTHQVIVRATDERGAFDEQSYTLTVEADTEAPSVTVFVSAESYEPGDEVTVRVLASDNVGVISRTLAVDGVPITLGPDAIYTFTATQPGKVHFEATATDAAGNVGHGANKARITDPNDTTAPVIVLTSPQQRDTVTYLTDITGSISDVHLDTYKIEVARLGSNEFRLIHEAEAAPAGDVLGMFDPTLLENDIYVVRVTATDLNGQSSTEEVTLYLDGQAKIGNFMTGATDVTIPVAGGPPIEFSRVYDTLHADIAGDLGYGWQICALEPRIRETVPVHPGEKLLGMFSAIPFKEGDKVYLTTPDCKRVGFTFRPVPTEGIFAILNPTFGTIYEPRWVADPGVEEELWGEWDRVAINDNFTGSFDRDNGYRLPLLRLPDGSYILAYLNVQYNPLGYQMIQKDGTRWHYSQFDGLLDVTDRNGNTLTVTGSGISSSSGQQLVFERDSQGRISRIVDPVGGATTYTYNDKGELEAVHGPDGRLKAHYDYAGPQPHFISEVNGVRESCGCTPSESEPVKLEYNLANRLGALVDALGGRTRFDYDLQGNTEQLMDALGNVTTLEYDDRGNVVRQTDPMGATVRSVYDTADNLIESTDARGFTSTMTYDARNNPIGVTDPYGNTSLMAYDEFNNVVAVTDQLGNVHSFSYDAKGRLTAILAPDGSTTTMTYDAQGRRLTVTDSNHNTQTLVYGYGPKPTRIIHPDGSSVTLTYNQFDQITTFVDENGHQSYLQYDAAGQLLAMQNDLGESVTLHYSGQRLQSVTDRRGLTTSYTYDAVGRALTVTTADGTVTSYAYDALGQQLAVTDALGRTTRNVYRPDRRLDSVTDPLGNVTRYGYDASGNRTAVTDANGHTTTFDFGARNLMVGQTDPLGNVWQFAYDARKHLTSKTDPNGNTTRFEYDERGLMTREIDALLGVTSRTYDPFGSLLSVTDANGHVTSFEYDSRHRLVVRRDAAGGTHTYEYDSVGNKTAETNELGQRTTFTYDELNRLVMFTDANGGVSQRAYDASGRVTSTTDTLGRVTRQEYDALNRLVATIDPTGAVERYGYDDVGNLTSVTDPLGRVTLNEYDGADRRVRVTDSAGGSQQFSYDGLGYLLSETDPLGRITRYTYDAASRLLSTTDARGGVTQYTYDQIGNRASVTDPVGNTTSYTYDALSRMIRETDPQGRSRVYDYDAIGNQIGMTDRNGRRRTFDFDVLDRMVGETWWDGASQVREFSYSYDAVGNLVGAADPDSRYAFSYDALNRQTSVDNLGTLGLPRVILTYGYDAEGNVTSVQDDSGVLVGSSYDARNRLVSRAWSGDGISSVRFDVSYDAVGQRVGLERFADLAGTQSVVTTSYAYDQVGRTAAKVHRNPTGAVLASYQYTSDLAGQLIAETYHGVTFGYAYDASGQLTSETRSDRPTDSYAYDGNGNPTGIGVVIGPGNRVLSDNQFDYAYDNEGNLVRKADRSTGEVTEYTYDFRNRMTSVETRTAGGIILHREEYRYDILDRRITVAVNGVARHTVYDGQHAWADYDATGTVQTRYLHGDRVDEIVARSQSGNTVWYLTDRLGTVRDLVNATGVVVNHLDYNAFGLLLGQTNPAVGDRFMFTGRELDGSGLYYYRARFYDPYLRRFLSEDSLGFAAGDMNVYRYVGNNPLGATDPSGHLAIAEFGLRTLLRGGAGIIGGVAGGISGGFFLGFVSGLVNIAIGKGTFLQGFKSGAFLGAAIGGVIGFGLGTSTVSSVGMSLQKAIAPWLGLAAPTAGWWLLEGSILLGATYFMLGLGTMAAVYITFESQGYAFAEHLYYRSIWWWPGNWSTESIEDDGKQVYRVPDQYVTKLKGSPDYPGLKAAILDHIRENPGLTGSGHYSFSQDGDMKAAMGTATFRWWKEGDRVRFRMVDTWNFEFRWDKWGIGDTLYDGARVANLFEGVFGTAEYPWATPWSDLD